MQKNNIKRKAYENNICNTCLSGERQLFSINPYHDIFYKFCETDKLPPTPILCWECIAILKKIKKFQDCVKFSQDLLHLQYNNKQKVLPTSLSRLEISNLSNVITYTHNENHDNKELDHDIKEETQSITEETELNEIKEESICYSDTDYNFGSNDRYLEGNGSDVKTDVKDTVSIKKEKCSVSRKKIVKRYKILIAKCDKNELENLTTKIPVQFQEAKSWLNKDKCSDNYKQLKYKCESCVSGWYKERRLIQHNKRFHDPGAQYECDICGKRFAEKRRLRGHISCHRYLYECRACAQRGCSLEMKRHLATHVRGRRVQCLECDAQFTNLRLFYRHQKELHEQFICDHCGKICKSKTVIAKHITNNHGVFECKICNISYKIKHSYIQHRNKKHSVSNGDDAYCVQCDKRFFNVYVYRSHLKYSSAHAHERKGDGSKKKVECPDCGRIYTKKSYMMNHYRYIHMKKTKHHCVLCDKYFLNSTKYIEHMRYNHEGATRDKNKLCNICGRGFAAKTTLINHIRTHSGERPFECEHCGAKFTQKYAMVSHVSHIHMKKKRRPCWQ